MYKILAKHPTEQGKVVITYGEEGYAEVDLTQPLPYSVPDHIESSFVGASMFGWDKPIANEAHRWVEENPRWH